MCNLYKLPAAGDQPCAYFSRHFCTVKMTRLSTISIGKYVAIDTTFLYPPTMCVYGGETTNMEYSALWSSVLGCVQNLGSDGWYCEPKLVVKSLTSYESLEISITFILAQ